MSSPSPRARSNPSNHHLHVAYDLQPHRADQIDLVQPLSSYAMRMEEEDDDDRYVELEDSGTVTTAAGIPNAPPDATAAVHETYWALLFLLSHPDQWETPRTTTTTPQVSTASTLQHWNEEESLYTTNDEMTAPPPSESQLPYAVFCDDAEVVLPQAHTASQLFGLETVTGMELEAAAGIPAISALVLRWLGAYYDEWTRWRIYIHVFD